MCTVPKRSTALQMIAVVVVLLIILSSCGGTDYPTTQACRKVAVPITEMRRECHAVGTDECAYMTTEQFTFKAVAYECNQKEKE